MVVAVDNWREDDISLMVDSYCNVMVATVDNISNLKPTRPALESSFCDVATRTFQLSDQIFSRLNKKLNLFLSEWLLTTGRRVKGTIEQQHYHYVDT